MNDLKKNKLKNIIDAFNAWDAALKSTAKCELFSADEIRAKEDLFTNMRKDLLIRHAGTIASLSIEDLREILKDKKGESNATS